MKGYISIIYVNTHLLSEEKIAVGGISVFGNDADIYFSDGKLQFALELMKGKNKKFILQNINLFKSKIFDIKSNLNVNLSNKASGENQELIDKNYLGYLHSYSQGVFGFGPPKPINIAEDSEGHFHELVRTFVGDFGKEKLNRLQAYSNLLLGSISLNAVHYIRDGFFVEKIFDQHSPAEFYELAYLCQRLADKLIGGAKIYLTLKTTYDLKEESKLGQLFQSFNPSFYQVDTELIKSDKVNMIDLDEIIYAFNLENKFTKVNS